MDNWQRGNAGNWQPPNYRPLIPPPRIPSFPPTNLPPPPIPPPPIPPPPLPPPFLPSFPDRFSAFSNQNCQNPGFYQEHQWPGLPITHHDHGISSLNKPNLVHDGTPSSTSPQTIVDRWISSKNISQRAKKVASESDSSTKIWVVKEKLNTAHSLIKEMENDSRTLNVMVKTVSPSEWRQKCSEIEEKKKNLTQILNELQLNGDDIDVIKKKCLKRSKKRARLKRQAERRKIEKEEEKVKTRNLHFQIDKWQSEMREDVEREQREEELQREADAVLWGVTQRKTETRRQIALLSSLLELRQVRAQRLTAAGNPVSQSQMDTFNTVIEKLKKMWTKHMDECLLEEQALRGMLTKADVKEDPVKTYKKLVLQEWEVALFGVTGSLDSNLTDEKLIETRRSWDQFVVPERTVLSSTIPPGWVLPVPPSSDQWRALLKY